MMEGKDIASFLIGFLLFALGLLPLLNNFGIGPSWFDVNQFLPTTVFGWIIAVGALYLVINSVIEITNSSAIGGLSIGIAFVCLALGLLPLLSGFGIGPEWFSLSFFGVVSGYIMNVILMAEGLFLMIAMIAMEM